MIAQQVTLATRRPKSHEGRPPSSSSTGGKRWLAGGLAPIARDVLARAQKAGPTAEFSPADVIERAVAAVGGQPLP